MKQKNLFFLLFPLMSLACIVLAPPNPDANRPLATVFDNLVCEPPCWNHVVPGITTEEQAREAMKRLAAGEQSYVSESKYPPGRVYISYQTDSGYGEIISVAIWDGVVKRIEFEGARRYLSLSYVLGTLGNPDYAFESMYGDSGPMLVLLYPSRGIQVLCLPRPVFIGTIRCNLESHTIVKFFAPTEYDEQLAYFFNWRGDESPEKEEAEYAQQFFCPWVGIDATYLSVNWGPLRYPEEYPAVSPAEIQSQCPTGE